MAARINIEDLPDDILDTLDIPHNGDGKKQRSWDINPKILAMADIIKVLQKYKLTKRQSGDLLRKVIEELNRDARVYRKAQENYANRKREEERE
uniref:Uncharacterized protein n=1 Tax=viral metagenome TaxID=1070528 RepID=A0A6M3KQT2_9ZZZZ